MKRRTLRAGLYAITDSALIAHDRLVESVAAAIAGGATLVQYREKHLDAEARTRAATALAALCQRHDVPLIINDDVELAAAVGAAGVHLGKDDASISAARARLGPNALIGVSCYNRLQNALDARDAGASYVAFGRFYKSRSKPAAVQADLALLQQAHMQLDVPIVAIGGITPEHGRTLIDAGASLLAVIHGVFGQPDIQAAARAYARLFGDS
ncbi:MAG: thiamine phosphate synthase [Gammaproteobacteria bacterium]